MAILSSVSIATATVAQALADTNDVPVTLQPGDVVRVDIWRESDLSGEFPIDETGNVTLPLLGKKSVVDIPLVILRDTLIQEYHVHLRNPSIRVTPLRRVHVLGHVARPGLYRVDPTVSVAEAISIAGGVRSGGDLGRIRIIRDGAVIRERVSAETPLSTADVRSGDQIFLDRRSVWYNPNYLINTSLSAIALIVALIRLR
jgi:polysaccharide biosynthesis/export protein